MIQQTRFGKKLPIPSTAEIKHDLRLMAAADLLVATSSKKERKLIIGDLAQKHGLSKDRAEMLVDRFGIGRVTLEGAAQELREAKS